MEATARAKYVRGSAQKMRLVADAVRAKPVAQAIALLHDGMNSKASREFELVIRSAVANLQSKTEGANVDVDDLKVKTVFVDGGPTLKRWKARAQGRAFRRLCRTSHLTVVVSD